MLSKLQTKTVSSYFSIQELTQPSLKGVVPAADAAPASKPLVASVSEDVTVTATATATATAAASAPPPAAEAAAATAGVPAKAHHRASRQSR